MQYLYLLRAGDYCKVGISANVRSRVSVLQSTNPQHVNIVATKLVEHPYEAEQELHGKLHAMRADGANEWFKLAPEQIIDLAIAINKYPELDVSERITLAEIVKLQRRQQRVIENKLDHIVNTYQRHFSTRPRSSKAEAEPSELQSKDPTIIPDVEIPQLKKDVWRAMIVINQEHKVSTSLLQRRLSLGYGRAARTVDELERLGVVGPLDGIQPRTILKYALDDTPDLASDLL